MRSSSAGSCLLRDPSPSESELEPESESESESELEPLELSLSESESELPVDPGAELTDIESNADKISADEMDTDPAHEVSIRIAIWTITH